VAPPSGNPAGSDELFTLGHHSNAIRTWHFPLTGQTPGDGRQCVVKSGSGRQARGRSGRMRAWFVRLLFAADGQQLLTADDFGVVKIFGLDKLPNLAPNSWHEQWEVPGLFSRGRMLAVTGGDFLQLWDLPARRRLRGPHRRTALARGFFPDGGTLALHGQRRNCLWNIQKRSE